MEQKLIVTADDIGLTKGNTDTILQAVDAGTVTRVSILANGEALEYALSEYAKRRNRLELAMHLNLTVGSSVSRPEEIPHLVDPEGLFRHSSFGLWCTYIFSSARVRSLFREEVAKELNAQLEKVRLLLATYGISLNLANGHQHVHMIPFVFNALVELPGITEVRITKEPVYIVPGALLSYFTPHAFALFVFSFLGRRHRQNAHKNNLRTNDYFLGLLFSGKMTLPVVKNGLACVAKKTSSVSKTTEILFHPGSATSGELSLWRKSTVEMKWNFSSWRARERNLLLTPVILNLFNTFRLGSVVGARTVRTWRDFWNTENTIYVSDSYKIAHYNALAEGMIALLPALRPLKLLDFGAGYGLSAEKIAATGIEVLLYDPIAQMQKELKKQKIHPGVHILSDTEWEHLSSGSVDAVLVFSVLQYLTREETEILLKRFNAILKPSGVLYVGDIVSPSAKIIHELIEIFNIARREKFFFATFFSFCTTFFSDYRRIRKTHGFSVYSEEDISNLLRNAGFVPERIQNIGLNQQRMMFRASIA